MNYIDILKEEIAVLRKRIDFLEGSESSTAVSSPPSSNKKIDTDKAWRESWMPDSTKSVGVDFTKQMEKIADSFNAFNVPDSSKIPFETIETDDSTFVLPPLYTEPSANGENPNLTTTQGILTNVSNTIQTTRI